MLGGVVERAVISGSLDLAELVGSTLRALLVGMLEFFCTIDGCGSVAAGTLCRAGCAEAVVVFGRVGPADAGLLPLETRPLPFPSVSFVITFVVEALRFVRFASETIGESALADTATANVRRAIPALSIRRW